MGGASSGKGGVADATLNVVPFIDLLACTICFLLISAVWSSMSRIDVDQALPKASKTPPKEQPKVEPKINLAITPTGYLVNLQDADKMQPTPKPDLVAPKRIPTLGDFKLCRGKASDSGACDGVQDTFKRYDRAKLREYLEQLMRDGGMGDKIKIMVSATDNIQYLHLIAGLDTVLAACEDKDRKSCLKNPSVGDINLLRAAGFSNFD